MIETTHILGFCCGLTIFCGRCGNNTCNGGYGEDGTCPDCPSAYELEDAQRDEGAADVRYAAVRATHEDIDRWNTAIVEQFCEAAGASDPKWLGEVRQNAEKLAALDHARLNRALAAARDVGGAAV